MIRFRILASIATMLMTLAPVGVVDAASLRVSPVGFELAAGQRAASLSVEDDGEAPMTVQVRVFRWIQRNGADVLESTEALVASPPFASLDAGAAQTVRLIRTYTQDTGAGEQAFRLLVDELPPTSGEVGQQVRLLMRHSVPVFVEPMQSGRAEIAWRAHRDGTGLRIAATNTGARRLRLANLKVRDAQGRLLAEQPGLDGYVLAGSMLDLKLACHPAAPCDAAPARIQADTDLGPLDASVAGL